MGSPPRSPYVQRMLLRRQRAKPQTLSADVDDPDLIVSISMVDEVVPTTAPADQVRPAVDPPPAADEPEADAAKT